eukprot:6149644-Pleurochrysis_carterae.AAC.1
MRSSRKASALLQSARRHTRRRCTLSCQLALQDGAGVAVFARPAVLALVSLRCESDFAASLACSGREQQQTLRMAPT